MAHDDLTFGFLAATFPFPDVNTFGWGVFLAQCVAAQSFTHCPFKKLLVHLLSPVHSLFL